VDLTGGRQDGGGDLSAASRMRARSEAMTAVRRWIAQQARRKQLSIARRPTDL